MSLRDKYKKKLEHIPRIDLTEDTEVKTLKKEEKIIQEDAGVDLPEMSPLEEPVVLTEKEKIDKEKFELADKINVLKPTDAEPEQEEAIKETEEDSGDKVELLVIRIGKNYFGIETNYVTEIIELQPITPVPLTQDYLIGMINIRNEIISVVDLNRMFLHKFIDITDDDRIVILNLKNMTTGILINRINSISVVNENKFIQNIESLDLRYQKFIKHIFRLNDIHVAVVDIDKLFSAEEFINVEVG